MSLIISNLQFALQHTDKTILKHTTHAERLNTIENDGSYIVESGLQYYAVNTPR